MSGSQSHPRIARTEASIVQLSRVLSPNRTIKAVHHQLENPTALQLLALVVIRLIPASVGERLTHVFDADRWNITRGTAHVITRDLEKQTVRERRREQERNKVRGEGKTTEGDLGWWLCGVFRWLFPGRWWFWMCGGVHGDKEGGGAVGLVVFEQLAGVVVVHDGKKRRKKRMVEFSSRRVRPEQERGDEWPGWWRREEGREKRGRKGKISCFPMGLGEGERRRDSWLLLVVIGVTAAAKK
ncbi:hypothetical protein HAX54_013221 [Datura stramonium]|uniref:Uncharacterized protein n=1 Tax=Datura stramonium TaxID=4076 RepID=A0ABS8TL15_DATST|nr:hypothetical protein [Datura stramonium]